MLLSVPIIPEFLYNIRHRNDLTTWTPPLRSTTPRTTTPTTTDTVTPFGFNETYYDLDPIPLDLIEDETSDNDNDQDQNDDDQVDYFDNYESKPGDKLTPRER